MAAGNATVVIEDVFVDYFTELRSGDAARGAADAGRDQRANDAASPRARWASDATDHHSSTRTREHACGAAYAAAGKSDDASNTTCTIERCNTLGKTDWTDCMHMTPLKVG